MLETKVLNNFFNLDYSWDNFIKSISDAYDLYDPNNKKEIKKEIVGKINFWQKLTITLDNISEDNFPGIEDKAFSLLELHKTISGTESKCKGYFGAVSLTNKEPSTGKHSDPVDVIYCQFVGSVTWTIFDKDSSKNFLLSPGDIIYVPKSTLHEVTSLTPRAAISFMFSNE